jgi:hypothetical protein
MDVHPSVNTPAREQPGISAFFPNDLDLIRFVWDDAQELEILLPDVLVSVRHTLRDEDHVPASTS